MEPQAKKLLAQAGFDVPESVLAQTVEQALEFAEKVRYPVVAKGVSPEILHKTEHRAVVTSIETADRLSREFNRLIKLPKAEAVLVETMISGIEIILGAKNDYQFGPVVLLGTGGIGVEIFNDAAIRMAPLKPDDVISMVDSLKGASIIKGFRGAFGVNMDALTDLTIRFSQLAMELEHEIESVDLNPVICTRDRCVIADARIILASKA